MAYSEMKNTCFKIHMLGPGGWFSCARVASTLQGSAFAGGGP